MYAAIFLLCYRFKKEKGNSPAGEFLFSLSYFYDVAAGTDDEELPFDDPAVLSCSPTFAVESGSSAGSSVGVGVAVGSSVGSVVGSSVGSTVGAVVTSGSSVGAAVGVGVAVAAAVGVGVAVAAAVGVGVAVAALLEEVVGVGVATPFGVISPASEDVTEDVSDDAELPDDDANTNIKTVIAITTSAAAVSAAAAVRSFFLFFP